MRIGITYDLKETAADGGLTPDAPDDLQEEFDSPATVDAIAGALRGLGHQVEQLGDGRGLLERLLARPPDFVFNFAEGQGVGRCREARVPAVLEMLSIPYTGSDPLTLAVTLDKDCAKRLVQSARVAIPWGLVVPPDREPRADQRLGGCPFPALVKPAWEGSSKGIRDRCLVERVDELLPLLKTMQRQYQQPLLLEEYIEGDELTVGIVGNRPPRIVGVMRVLPREPVDRFIYSLEVKRDFRRRVRYECPPRLPAETVAAVSAAALRAYEVLGCRDVARVDFRLRDGTPYFLEVNPLPGLNPETSDLVILARLAGWDYTGLIRAILQAALDRHPSAATSPSTVTA
jgi:D-alanine-D-alanine ligase